MTMVRTVRKSTWRRIVLPLAVALFIMGLVPLALWQDVWAGAALVNEEPAETTHRVEAGDSLFALANQYHVELEALAAANGLETNAILFKNQDVTIPAGSAEKAATDQAASMETAAPEDGDAGGSVIATAQEASGFDTLLTALDAAGLTDALQGEGPFTIFAPTDTAFEDLPEGRLDELLADAEGELAQILQYHVVSGEILAADIEDGATAETLQGGEVLFTVGKGGPRINSATIVTADIQVSNGVIHVIDTVLTPPADAELVGEPLQANAGASTQSVSANTEDAGTAPASRQTSPPEPRTYSVQAGDSLFALAREFGVSQDALAAANGLATNAILYKRQVLVIPSDEPATAMTPQDGTQQDTMADDAAGTDADEPEDTVAEDEDTGDAAMEADIDEESAPAAEAPDDAAADAGDDASDNGMSAGDMADDEPAVDEVADDGEADSDDEGTVPDSAADEAMADDEMEGEETASEEIDGTPANIVVALEEAGDFDTLVMVLEEAGLADELQGNGPFTLFAPNDSVFEALPQNTLDTLLANPELVLTQILRYHVVPEELASADITDGLAVKTLQGAQIAFRQTPDGATVNGVPLVRTDIAAGNGVIHVIEAILIPRGEVQPTPTPEPAEEDVTSTPQATPKPTATPPATTTPEPEEETAGGEMDGEDGMDDGAADEDAPAGDEPASDEAESTDANDMAEGLDDIVATVEAAGDFETLLAALEATGLAQDLQESGPFTLFAPTDAAFEALPTETFEALLADPEGDLTQILLYHVVPGRLTAANMADGLPVETLQGSELTFGVDEDNPTVEGVDILLTNIEASNGVIHMIDVVLSPPPAE